MNGTKLLIDIAIKKPGRRAREFALSELVDTKSCRAIQYVACNTKFSNTARQALMCLYAMDAIAELKSISKRARSKETRIYATTLVNEYEMNKDAKIMKFE